ncbi:MAG TPA: cupin domain-containing protein [Dehalococcoidia bacterium]|nr:cupin domain-containing protein [Dehalococcoidia bacterium]
MEVFPPEELDAAQRQGGRLYHEFLRVPALSAGLYVLPAGAEDPQQPHAEDEIYHVLRGRARVRVAGEECPIGPGDTIYVAARVEHRFLAISEELALLVVFAPAHAGG